MTTGACNMLHATFKAKGFTSELLQGIKRKS